MNFRDTPHKYFKTSDGITLAYRDYGTGAPLLCLPGLTRNSDDFEYLANELDTKTIRMICLDYRGRGASQFAPPETYDIPTESRDVLELLDHLALKSAPVIGTSRGGLIAMTIAALAPHRLTGVCLNDIGPEFAPEGLKSIATYLGRQPPFQNYEEAALARAKFPGFEGVPHARWLSDAYNSYRQEDTGLRIRYDPHLRDNFEAGTDLPLPDLWPLFDAMKGLPIALIRGENSNILTVKSVVEMRRRRPDIIFTSVPNRGHIPFLDEPESLSVINTYLKEIS